MTKAEKRELAAAYALLEDCIPLALRQLYAGGVSAIDQYSFWERVIDLQLIVDVVDFTTAMGGAFPTISNRISELLRDVAPSRKNCGS